MQCCEIFAKTFQGNCRFQLTIERILIKTFSDLGRKQFQKAPLVKVRFKLKKTILW